MELSARNIIKGTIKEIDKGAVNSEIILEIAPGKEITSIITNKSSERLGLAVGKEACAIIKASAVIIGIE